MSYQIDYRADPTCFQKKEGRFWMLLVMTLTVFAFFLSCIRHFYPDSFTRLKTCLWPGSSSVTWNAAKVLVQEIQAGQPITETALNFCREILYHAGIR